MWILQEIGAVHHWYSLSQASNLVNSCTVDYKHKLLEIPFSVRRHEMIMSHWTPTGPSMSSFTTLRRYGQLHFRNDSLNSRFLREIPLTELLQESRLCQATDPRDKVFALLNLLETNSIVTRHSWLLDVDYDIPTPLVYTRAARYTIETDCTLEIMCYKDGTSKLTGLPSWVPDWTQQHLFPLHRISMPNHYRSQFHPNMPTSMYWMSSPKLRNHTRVATFSTNGQTIGLKGYHLDSIARLGLVWKKPLDAADRDVFKDWVDVFTGDRVTELTDLPFKADPWPIGIKTTPLVSLISGCVSAVIPD